jgi:hypothetical protein
MLNLKVYAYAIAAVVALSALAVTYRTIRNAGYEAALTKVEKKNEAVKQAVDEVRRTVDQCHASGGVWEVISGRCND